jgi:hypothetical protein
MIRYEWYRSGSIFGIKYDMSEGASLKRHAHGAETLHNVIVLEGGVIFDGAGFYRELFPGDVFDFDGTQPHEITALEGGATILNIFLNGIPEQYKELPTSEHAGEF